MKIIFQVFRVLLSSDKGDPLYHNESYEECEKFIKRELDKFPVGMENSFFYYIKKFYVHKDH